MPKLNLNEKISRRTFMLRGRNWLAALGIGATGVYPFVWERFWYDVNEVEFVIPHLPPSFSGWRVVQFSDVHYGFHYDAHQFQRVVRIINRLRPDLLFFTGDLAHGFRADFPSLLTVLKQLESPSGGKWAVLGNHDYLPKQQVVEVLQKSGFNVLQNSKSFVTKGNDRLYIAGLKDVLYENPDIETAVQRLAGPECTLLLVHEPDIADLSSRYGFHAQFSGHSHGGQVKIPFYGQVVRAELAEKYVEGTYFIGANKMPLYVNRGIGTTNIPVRLFCRPEITVFHLRAKGS